MNDLVQDTPPNGARDAAFNIAGRVTPAGNGLEWWTNAWPLFTRQIGMWIGLIVVAFVVFAVASLVPVIGLIATMLLWPVIVGGVVLAFLITLALLLPDHIAT